MSKLRKLASLSTSTPVTATELVKTSTAKHKGLFFYLNRKKKLNLPKKMLTGKDKTRYEKALKLAKMRSRS